MAPRRSSATATGLTTAESPNVSDHGEPGVEARLHGPAEPLVSRRDIPDPAGRRRSGCRWQAGDRGTNSTATVTLSLAAGGPASAMLTCTGRALEGRGRRRGDVLGLRHQHGRDASARGHGVEPRPATTVTAATGDPFVVAAARTATITLTHVRCRPRRAQKPGHPVGPGFHPRPPSSGKPTVPTSSSRTAGICVIYLTWTTITTQTTDNTGRATFLLHPR